MSSSESGSEFGDALFRLDGKVAVVTGTTSGIGRRFAQVLDRNGARVVLAARRIESNSELAGQLRDALPVACDITSPADRQALLEAALDRYGQIDVLVNNAGDARTVPAEDEDLQEFGQLWEVNTRGLFALTQLVARQMLARGRGSVVNIASSVAVASMDRYPLAGYAASKAAVLALTRELAAQWSGRGVRVNAISPGWFPTAMNGWLADPDQAAWIRQRTPIGRPGRLDELDGPLLFLASDASSYVTGQNILVDGGWSCR